MWKFLLNVLLMAAIITAWMVLLAATGCASFTEMADGCEQHWTLAPCKPLKAQSWDQENLKRNDHGCPTAIYRAPGGNLEQCD